MDAISLTTIISQVVTVAVAGATGWGWLVPTILPLAGSLINTLIGIRARRSGNRDSLGETDTEPVEWMNAILPFVQAVVGAVFSVGISNDESIRWWATLLTGLVLAILEGLRLNFGFTRDTLYKPIFDKIKSCCPSCNRGDQTPLLGNV